MNEDFMTEKNLALVAISLTKFSGEFSKWDIARISGVPFEYVDLYMDRFVREKLLSRIGAGLYVLVEEV